MYLWYEDCSNMNASSFITFVTYMLRQNGIRFYKGLYVIFKLAPDLKKNTVYLSIYSALNEGYYSKLTKSMPQTLQWYRRVYNSSINRWNFLKFIRKYPHIVGQICEKIVHFMIKAWNFVHGQISNYQNFWGSVPTQKCILTAAILNFKMATYLRVMPV